MNRAGHVYVLGFSNGCVKVGRTQNTGQRLTAHKGMARKFGLTIADEWLSPLHAEWLANERTLKKIAVSLGGVVAGQEYYSGITYAAVVEKAEGLPFTAITEPEPLPTPVPAARASGSAKRSAEAAEWDAAVDAIGARVARSAAIQMAVTKNAERIRKARQLLDMGVLGSNADLLNGYAAKEIEALLEAIDAKEIEVRQIIADECARRGLRKPSWAA